MMVKISLLCILLLVAFGMREAEVLQRDFFLVAVTNRADFLQTAVGVLSVQNSFCVSLQLAGIDD